MAKMIYVVCEGQSECAFVSKVLFPWFGARTNWQCQLLPFIVVTSHDRKKGKVHRGGIISFDKVKNDLLKCLSSGAPVTTMIDYYRLPVDFPGYNNLEKMNDPLQRVLALEASLGAYIYEQKPTLRKDYFLPYFQLHEFETLFYTDLSVLKTQYIDPYEQEMIDKLISETLYIMPEDINHGDETAPSKRLLKCIGYQKGDAVTFPLKDIGIEKMIEKCPHFGQWVGKLLDLSTM